MNRWNKLSHVVLLKNIYKIEVFPEATSLNEFLF